jgi:hypothetical protein
VLRNHVIEKSHTESSLCARLCRNAAERQGDGSVSVSDFRVGTAKVELEDIIGWFKVHAGKVVSYQANKGYALVSKRGPFLPDAFLEKSLLAELGLLSSRAP